MLGFNTPSLAKAYVLASLLYFIRRSVPFGHNNIGFLHNLSKRKHPKFREEKRIKNQPNLKIRRMMKKYTRMQMHIQKANLVMVMLLITQSSQYQIFALSFFGSQFEGKCIAMTTAPHKIFWLLMIWKQLLLIKLIKIYLSFSLASSNQSLDFWKLESQLTLTFFCVFSKVL